MSIGKTRDEPSRARILIQAPSPKILADILRAIQPHGAAIERDCDCRCEQAPADGVFPEEFYATTHLPTQIRLQGGWVDVEPVEMDLGVVVSADLSRARTVPMGEVRRGELVVTGRAGIRVSPLQRPRERDAFSFMESQVSAERPHGHIIADVARRMKSLKDEHGKSGQNRKVLFAGGPAIIHAGGREALMWLIDAGFIHVLFCGNALAAHDMEADLYGTSLGYGLSAGRTVPHGHEHHLRTINRIRAVGSIRTAVERGVIKQGIMASCVKQGVEVVMAGTIRDDGPLPGVVTDSIRAQAAMRAAIPGVDLALLVASTLHAVATGNLLPASVPTVCVDVNPAVPTKLADRGSFQAVGLVMDAASFLRDVARELGWSS
ncbi:TIGR00300 family protein [Nitrospira sp. KM1]|uniref:ornithine cyclodeaminase n=1 Tax=Nitrospira sp. KM1 TaxID=1936990 RepID=UPI0013A71392|nr:TIGR00300 family protein [Nitrospira sp. KM1]BCA55678.1 TIGR00300 family protein [Nitrospira sp. KM1]